MGYNNFGLKIYNPQIIAIDPPKENHRMQWISPHRDIDPPSQLHRCTNII